MNFDQAYRAYYERVKVYLSRKFRGHSIDMDDITQDAFTEAWRSWEKCTGNVFSWLIGIARNVILHAIRDMNRIKRGEGVSHVEYNAEMDYRSVNPSQEHALQLMDMKARISRLQNDQRIAINGIMLGMTPTEIAKKRNVTRQAVDQSLKKARASLAAFS